MKRTEGPMSTFTPKPLDEEMFHKLFDILHDGCFEGNYAATARAIGISRISARRWARSAPKGPYWNHILDQTLRAVYQHMKNSKHKSLRRRAEKVAGQLHRAELHTLKEYIEYNEIAQAGAVRHLLMTINEAPGQEMSTKDLRKPAFSGGYSARSLRQAAEILQLTRHTEGFGDEKITYYRLPRSDDEE